LELISLFDSSPWIPQAIKTAQSRSAEWFGAALPLRPAPAGHDRPVFGKPAINKPKNVS
jgi:hypothetical protein